MINGAEAQTVGAGTSTNGADTLATESNTGTSDMRAKAADSWGEPLLTLAREALWLLVLMVTEQASLLLGDSQSLAGE